MAKKKAYFFEVKLCCNKKEQDYQLLKKLFQSIIDKYATDNGEYKSLDLTNDGEKMHSIMDIFDYTDNRMFVRLSKQKPSNSLIQREYTTYIQDDVLPGTDENKNGIEQYTYGSLDYETGIFTFVSSKGTLTEKALAQAVYKFASNYELKLTAVPNADAIDSIYNGQQSQITNVEIEVPLPDPEVLKNILGWTDDKIIETLAERDLRTVIVIKPPARQSITMDTEESKSLLDLIKLKLKTYNKSKVKAKSKNVKLREFDLFEENFSYPIEIKTYHREENEKIPLTVEELVVEYRKALIMVFRENKDLITTITGRFKKE